jgi:hypothetical protein
MPLLRKFCGLYFLSASSARASAAHSTASAPLLPRLFAVHPTLLHHSLHHNAQSSRRSHWQVQRPVAGMRWPKKATTRACEVHSATMERRASSGLELTMLPSNPELASTCVSKVLNLSFGGLSFGGVSPYSKNPFDHRTNSRTHGSTSRSGPSLRN